MIGAIFTIMMLRLHRDGGALVMVFLLPALIYVIFALIFTSTTSGDNTLRAAFFIAAEVTVENEETAAVRSALASSDTLLLIDKNFSTREELEAFLRDGEIDAAVVQQASVSDLGQEAAFLVIGEASKPIAALSVAAEVERQIALALPRQLLEREALLIEAIAGGFSPEQKKTIDATIDEILIEKPDTLEKALLVTVDQAAALSGSENTHLAEDFASSTYYAGAVAIMFLLFASVQGGLTILEEKNLGVNTRLLLSPWRAFSLTTGRFLFLMVLGAIQCVIILSIAAVFFDVPVIGSIAAVSIITLSAAAASAGFGLLIVSLFSTAQQAHAASSFVVLIMSAVGGSMAPRYLMPEWLKTVGSFTPNAWAIDAYYQAIVNTASFERLVQPVSLLFCFGLVSYAAAAALAYYFRD